MDEPTTGLDPQARHLIWERLRQLLGQGKTIFLTTHFMDEAERLCHRLAIMDHAAALGLGFSTFVSIGNKADISGNDLLSYWESDPRTDVILLYVESFGNPRNFARIARRVAQTKPVIVVKSGRSAVGARATGSTGAAAGASMPPCGAGSAVARAV